MRLDIEWRSPNDAVYSRWFFTNTRSYAGLGPLCFQHVTGFQSKGCLLTDDLYKYLHVAYSKNGPDLHTYYIMCDSGVERWRTRSEGWYSEKHYRSVPITLQFLPSPSAQPPPAQCPHAQRKSRPSRYIVVILWLIVQYSNIHRLMIDRAALIADITSSLLPSFRSSVHPSVCPSVLPSILMPVRLSFWPSVRLFVSQFGLVKRWWLSVDDSFDWVHLRSDRPTDQPTDQKLRVLRIEFRSCYNMDCAGMG